MRATRPRGSALAVAAGAGLLERAAGTGANRRLPVVMPMRRHTEDAGVAQDVHVAATDRHALAYGGSANLGPHRGHVGLGVLTCTTWGLSCGRATPSKTC